MLKTCCECIASFNSSREDNDTYGVRLNRDIQNTMWPTRGNEDIYKLPRPLSIENSMSIRGIKLEPVERIYFSLKTGDPSYSNQEFAFQMEIDFISDGIMLRTPKRESKDMFGQKPSNILNTSEFFFKVTRTEDTLIDIYIGTSIIDTIELDQETFDSITHFTLSKDVIKVNELTFTYE